LQVGFDAAHRRYNGDETQEWAVTMSGSDLTEPIVQDGSV
jgi:hypothetical protein